MCIFNYARFFILFAVFMASWILYPRLACADYVKTQEEIRQELSNIKKSIEAERKKSFRLSNVVRRAERDIKKSNRELRRIEKRQKELKQTLSVSDKELDSLEKVVQELGKKVIGLKQIAVDRIKYAYIMHRQMSLIDYLVNSKTALDAEKRSRYLELLVEYDRNNLYHLAKTVKKLVIKKNNLSQLREQRAATFVKITALGDHLKKKRVEANEILKKAEIKRKEHQTSIVEYRKSAKRLEQILAQIMGSGESYVLIKADRKLFENKKRPPRRNYRGDKGKKGEIVYSGFRDEDEERVHAKISTKSFKGKNFSSLKSTLPLPVSGSVIRKFGARHHSDFSDVVYVKGLEFRARKSAKVKAVTDGKVIFTELVPEYGRVVILDHGNRYYTLYGRLKKPTVSVGTIVSGGDQIGITGAENENNFYFELRHKGKAINPWSYFQYKPKYRP